MRKFYILLSTFCMLLAITVSAKQKEYKGKMSINPLQLEQVGDSLHINIDFNMTDVKVKARRSITLIPILVGSNKEQKLSEVMVKGRINYLTSKREVALMNKAQTKLYNQNLPYAIIKGYKHNGNKRILYSKTIAFEPWMKDARLDIQEDLCGCGNPPRLLATSELMNSVKLEKSKEPYIVTPYLSYLQPISEEFKRREMVGEVFLNFVVSQFDLRPKYMNNPQELKKITDMANEIKNDTNITVEGISIEGYASPEGPLEFNKYLSEGRANSLANYMATMFDYPKDMYHVVFGGENWKGLFEKVSSSDIQYKQEVLSILNNTTINDQTRKTQLKSLNGGEPYNYMLKEYYPSLRKAICKIDYYVKGFNVVEAKEVLKTNPKNLSLNELYLVANTYEMGSTEFINVFEIASKMFPKDETANINAASAALSRKDIVSAERYLNNVRSRVRIPEYDNAMGVLFLLKGDYEKAENYLKAAASTGLKSAEQNLLELKKARNED